MQGLYWWDGEDLWEETVESDLELQHPMNLCLLCLGLHSQSSLHVASWQIITIKQKPYAIAAPQTK